MVGRCAPGATLWRRVSRGTRGAESRSAAGVSRRPRQWRAQRHGETRPSGRRFALFYPAGAPGTGISPRPPYPRSAFRAALGVSRGRWRFVRMAAPNCATEGAPGAAFRRGFARRCGWRLLGCLLLRAAVVIHSRPEVMLGAGGLQGARGPYVPEVVLGTGAGGHRAPGKRHGPEVTLGTGLGRRCALVARLPSVHPGRHARTRGIPELARREA